MPRVIVLRIIQVGRRMKAAGLRRLHRLGRGVRILPSRDEQAPINHPGDRASTRLHRTLAAMGPLPAPRVLLTLKTSLAGADGGFATA
jgi:hypothetical protein